MFDGEDALGQITMMSLDNQKNLKLVIQKDPIFMKTAEQVAKEMNRWSSGFLGRKFIKDWKEQLDLTTKSFRARGLHLDDRNIRELNSLGFSAAIIVLILYVVNNHQQ